MNHDDSMETILSLTLGQVNEKVHYSCLFVDNHLLSWTSQELRICLQKFSGEKASAKYSTFAVESESQKYGLAVEGYSGTAGEYLSICVIWDLNCKFKFISVGEMERRPSTI